MDREENHKYIENLKQLFNELMANKLTKTLFTALLIATLFNQSFKAGTSIGQFIYYVTH
ncbi:hypothetical protein [Daejeonella sp.]|uniref:hypothetical protein n=1 Tax=Daejeonella sp. TaxID=2805397 RepID=UPI0025C73877|nr:hypothetical protein [Daejeonella sp.]